MTGVGFSDYPDSDGEYDIPSYSLLPRWDPDESPRSQTNIIRLPKKKLTASERAVVAAYWGKAGESESDSDYEPETKPPKNKAEPESECCIRRSNRSTAEPKPTFWICSSCVEPIAAAFDVGSDAVAIHVSVRDKNGTEHVFKLEHDVRKKVRPLDDTMEPLIATRSTGQTWPGQ